MCLSVRRPVCAALLAAIFSLQTGRAAAPSPSAINAGEVKEWLTFIASDDLKGRRDFTPELERAAAYISDHLRQWGVRPAGDDGTYLQTVHVGSYQTTSHSSVTVKVGRETRTFRDGDGVFFPRNAGAPSTATFDHVEFVG